MNSQYNIVTLILLSLFASSLKADELQYNLDFLDAKERKNVDMTRLTNPNFITPGDYVLNVYVNGKPLSDGEKINYNSESIPCISAKLVELIGLHEKALSSLQYDENGCANLQTLNGIAYKTELAKLTLNINVPQSYLNYTNPNWIPKSQWDNGINGAIFDYNVSANYNKNHGSGDSKSLFSNGVLGFNLGALRVRSDYQASYTDNQNYHRKNFDFNRLYAYMPLKNINSKLQIGQNYINSRVFDTWRFIGVSLGSDNGMLPPSLRGYAPEIVGVAKTNALVKVTDATGSVVYNSVVPAGPFKIQNIPTYTLGTLDVTVEEENGEVQRFSVQSSSLPYLVRPGHFEYSLATGKANVEKFNVKNIKFLMGDFLYGLLNETSLFGGTILANDYQSGAIGLAQNIKYLGTFSIDLTHASANLQTRYVDNKTESGNSWRINYSKYLEVPDINVVFSGYRFTDRHFISMAQFVSHYETDQVIDRPKERYQLNLTKNFDKFNITLNMQKQTYWDRDATEQYGIIVGTTFDVSQIKNISASLAYAKTKSQYNSDNNDSISVMLNIPLNQNQYINWSTYKSSGYLSNKVSYSQNDDGNYYNLGLGYDGGRQSNDLAYLSGMLQAENSLSQYSASTMIDNRNNASLSGSLSGGMVLTQHGLAYNGGNNNGRARVIIDTDEPNIPLLKANSVTNSQGLGVIPSVVSYNKTTVGVKVENLPKDIDAPNPLSSLALTEGAIGYKKIPTYRGDKIFAAIMLLKGEPAYFGSYVYTAQGREVGIVADSGIAWLTGVKGNEVLDVIWGNGRCQLTLPEQLSNKVIVPCL
ncbi:fimbria/pilus outer membrane usher protein [Providencia rettgeri]|uniref:fimbria/pilus outer membrane usher protein n=1 Tax=Providencia rettgeri TaxID=587 RepID=UPI0023AA43F2|nr:fimbria/pilus outer membrane usher protein [Providencia rettgeri]